MNDQSALGRILAEERQLLLAGNLAGLPALAPRKEEALRALAQNTPSHALAALRRDLAANQVLLGAAAKGIRAALDRLDAIRTVAQGLCAYNAKGEVVRHGPVSNSMERRA